MAGGERPLPQPFLLWVDFFDPHEPWDAPEYMVRPYDPDYDGNEPMLHPNYGKASDYTPKSCATCAPTIARRRSWSIAGSGASSRKIDDLACGTTPSSSSPPTTG
jgi:hypothetical protein